MTNRLKELEIETPDTTEAIDCLINCIASYKDTNTRKDFEIATKVNKLTGEIRNLLK